MERVEDNHQHYLQKSTKSTGRATNVERENYGPCTSDIACRSSSNGANNRLFALWPLRAGGGSSGRCNKTSELATATNVQRSYSSKLGTNGRTRKTKDTYNELKVAPMMLMVRLMGECCVSLS